MTEKKRTELEASLSPWGWNSRWQALREAGGTPDLLPGRITTESRQIYTVEGPEGPVTAGISGAYHYRAVLRSDYPAVGDWILYKPSDGNKGVIEQLLPRQSCFSRKTAGERTEEQIIAANIDTVLLVFGINGGRNFTSGGLERYLTLAWESGAVPVVVLNKADLCSAEEREKALLTAENSAPGVSIYEVSALTGEGLEGLTGSISPGSTVALTGPSGVGKSTIINALAGRELQKTTSQREGDLKGRHTTTRKEMFRLPGGLILIDTPGLKEIQLWASEEALAETFDDIALLARECRFKDCTHRGEPGCAVQQALSRGELEHRRYENYLNMEKELNYLKTRQDSQAARMEREKWKGIAKIQKDLKKQNKRS